MFGRPFMEFPLSVHLININTDGCVENTGIEPVTY